MALHACRLHSSREGVWRESETGAEIVAPSLDQTITDVMASLAVLLVFVVAFFSALLGPVDRAVGRDLPGDPSEQSDHFTRLRRLVALSAVFLIFTAACFALLMPLTVESVSTWAW